MIIRHWVTRREYLGEGCYLLPCRRATLPAESGVDRGSDSGVEVEARIGSYVRSSQCRIDPSNGQSPVVQVTPSRECRLAQRAEGGAQLFREEPRFLPGGEVTA